jgi:hypothetical protein
MATETRAICEQHLKESTEQYWELQDNDATALEYLPYYVEHLLRDEIDCARQLGEAENKPRVPQYTCQTLVLLVGYSLEPLLQSIHVYQPQCIILIANRDYHELDESRSGEYKPLDGERFIQAFLQPCIDQMVEQGLIQQPKAVQPKQVDAATPSVVFQALRDVLHQQEDVVIDITGGKKSMVTGAYLYAAFAQDVAISYVDFDDDVYDHRRGRPYGYRCRIGTLANPYTDFALRNWERVRSLYSRNSFREARELLVGKDGTQGEGTLAHAAATYLPGLCDPIKKLAIMLEFYRRWDDGNYGDAYNTRSETGLADEQMPSAVTLLGTDWFHFKGPTYHPADNFFDDDDRLRAYAYDELARVRRLIVHNEDYRSAFLKAGGLNEVLMVSRFVRQCPETYRSLLITDLNEGLTPKIGTLFKSLREGNGRPVTHPLGAKKPQDVKFRFNLSENMAEWWKDCYVNPESRERFFPDFNKFTHLRNKLIHTYASVPRPYAEAALAFVQANFDDFRQNKPDTRTFVTEALRWSELCKHCGLDAWLHPTLCADLASGEV